MLIRGASCAHTRVCLSVYVSVRPCLRLCVYVSVYVHVCEQSYIFNVAYGVGKAGVDRWGGTHVHVTQQHVWSYAHACTCAYAGIHTYILHACTHTCIQSYIRTYNACIPTYLPAYTHTHTGRHADTLRHTHTHPGCRRTCRSSWLPWGWPPSRFGQVYVCVYHVCVSGSVCACIECGPCTPLCASLYVCLHMIHWLIHASHQASS